MPAERTDAPTFSRTRSDGELMAELRQNTPRWVLDVFDALSMAAGDEHRCDYINRVLETEAKKELHRLSLIHRVAGGNPTVLEQLGMKQQ